MTTSTHLLGSRSFLPLFVTQFLNAFNDNLYKNAMVLFVVYSVYNSPEAETAFSGLATAVFVLPFVLLSATSGQLADMRDKAKIIRWIKLCEIAIMAVGAFGLYLAWQGTMVDGVAIPLLFLALFAMGVHSTFFGPIKYSILPQHLEKDEVLAGTGLVEAGTYVAILMGMTIGGWISVEWAMVMILVVAVVGYLVSRSVPSAPPMGVDEKVDWNPLTASWALTLFTIRNIQLRYAVLAISLFWTIAAILSVQFIPLAKNVLLASKEVAAILLVSFSLGIAIGSVSINMLLKGEISARYSARSVLAMGVLILGFYYVCRMWPGSPDGQLMDVATFISQPMAIVLLLLLLGIAIAGGMFVVPLYAFLTTRVEANQASRSVAANNFISSLFMTAGAFVASSLGYLGIALEEQLLVNILLVAGSAWVAIKLHEVE